jgi:hypothetical protein
MSFWQTVLTVYLALLAKDLAIILLRLMYKGVIKEKEEKAKKG